MNLRTLLLMCLISVFALSVYAQESTQPEYPYDNDTLEAYLTTIAALPDVVTIMTHYRNEDNAKERFKEHMELTRISSPSRQEIYRALELKHRLMLAGFEENEIMISTDRTGFPGSPLNLVDGLPVYQACAVIKGRTPAQSPDNPYSTPKVVIEGHIDTVNPDSIEVTTMDSIPDHVYDIVRIQPITEPLISTPAELAALPDTLNFTWDETQQTYKLEEDDNFKKAYRRFANLEAAEKGDDLGPAYRIYIPGYSDAMGNTVNVYTMAKYFKDSNIVPVYDIWFCFTAGEEGRGNLAGMKQIYGYNQDAPEGQPKGRNALNVVANLSIDGGTLSIHYLGSHRYEIEYEVTGDGGNAAMAAARAIDAISKIKAPHEKDSSKPKTTYTVGVVYPNTTNSANEDGSNSTSFEIDMRSPVEETLREIAAEITPLFAKGAELENKAAGGNVVRMKQNWFGDRPAHKRNFDLMRTDPLIYAGWKTYETYLNTTGVPFVLPQYPDNSTSLNDNVPAAMDIPSVNLNIGTTATGGGGHAFYEWGVPGLLETEAKRFERVMVTLLAIAGVHEDTPGLTETIPAAYEPVGLSYSDTGWPTPAE